MQASRLAAFCFCLLILTNIEIFAASDHNMSPTGSAIRAFENQIADQLINQINKDFLILPADGLGLEYRATRTLGSRLAVLAYYQQQIMSIDTKLLNSRNQLRLASLQATEHQLQQQRDNTLQDAALSPYHGPQIDLLRLVSLYPVHLATAVSGTPDTKKTDTMDTDNGIDPLLAELLLLGRTLDKPITLSAMVTPQECAVIRGQLTQLIETNQLTDSLDLRLREAGIDATTRRQYYDEFDTALQQHVVPSLGRLTTELSCDDINAVADTDKDASTDPAYYTYRLKRFGAAELNADAVHVLGEEALRELQSEITSLWQGLHPEVREDQLALTKIRKDALLYLGNTAADRQDYLSLISELVMKVSEQLAGTVLDLSLPDLEIIAEPDLLAPSSLPFTYRFSSNGPAQLAVNFNSTASFSQHQLTARTYYSSVPGLHLVRHGFVTQSTAGVPPILGTADNPAYFDGWPLYLTNLLLNDAKQIGLARLGLLELNAEMAAMLVIDTGIHGRGWSRQAAINFLVANTVIATYHAERLVDEVRFRPASMNSAYLGMTQIQALLAEDPAKNSKNQPPLSWKAALAAGPVAASQQQALRVWLMESP